MKQTIRHTLLVALSALAILARAAEPQATAQQSDMKLKLLMAKLPVCHDTVFYYNLIEEIVRTAIECDSLDSRPDAKGKVKPRYRHANSASVGKLRRQLVDGGIYFCHTDDQRSLRMLELYISTQHHPLFDKQRQNIGLASLYASRAAYGIKDYRRAEAYADRALTYDEYAKEAALLKIYCMKMQLVTERDDKIYIATLLALHEKDKSNAAYANLIIEYYTERSMKPQLAAFVDSELQVRRQSKMLWALKGELHMEAHQWDSAVTAYEQAVAKDSVFLPAIYNIGICYTSKAIQMRDSIESRSGKTDERQTTEIKAILACGQRYLEHAQQLDPDRHTVDWAPPLYQIYYALGDDRAERIRQLIKY